MKNAVKITSLFLLLFLTASVPFLLIMYENSVITEKTMSMLITSDALLDGGYDKDMRGRSLWERLMMMDSAVKIYTVTSEPAYDILTKLDDQLDKMYDYCAIPYLPPSKLISLGVEKQTYLNSSDGEAVREQVISVWNITAEYTDYIIYGCVDTDTYAVCDLAITSRSGDFVYDSQYEGDAFITYLQSIAPIGGDTGRTFSTGGFYGDTSLHIYVVSVDDRTGTTTDYRFGSYVVDVNTGDIRK